MHLERNQKVIAHSLEDLVEMEELHCYFSPPENQNPINYSTKMWQVMAHDIIEF